MGGIQDFDQFDSLGLAELVRQGQVTALELCEESIERINRHNPLLKYPASWIKWWNVVYPEHLSPK